MLVNAQILVVFSYPWLFHWDQHFKADDFQPLVTIVIMFLVMICFLEFAMIVVVGNILVDVYKRVVWSDVRHYLNSHLL
jgi:hypothetical protein